MTQTYQLELNQENIDKASEFVASFLKNNKTESKETVKVRLGVEETLLRFLSAFEEGKMFSLICKKSFGRTKIIVSVSGQRFNPYSKSNSAEENSLFMRTALANMGSLPVWKYSDGTNTVTFSVTKHQVKSWVQLIIAIVLAIIAGLILKAIPVSVSSFINQDIITPLNNTFLKLLSGISGPMIFLATVWGIYSVGDISAFSDIGRKLMGILFLSLTALIIVMGCATIPVFNLQVGESQAMSGFSSVFGMILDIVPGNILLPFTEGNTLQILFLGIVMGMAMIIIDEKTQTVALFAEQLNYIVQLIMSFISKLVPFFVFGSLLDIIMNDKLNEISVSYKLFAVNVAAAAFLLVFHLAFVCIREKVSPAVYMRKAMKGFIICLTTASSAAAFSTSLETCKKEYGIEESLANFGVPFAQIIYKPTVAFLFFSSAVFAAERFGITISVSWFVTAFLLSIILSIATPPIPGGTMASLSVLAAQLALPLDGIAVVLALNIVLDFIDTPVFVFSGHAMLVVAADKFDMLDKKVLRSLANRPNTAGEMAD